MTSFNWRGVPRWLHSEMPWLSDPLPCPVAVFAVSAKVGSPAARVGPFTACAGTAKPKLPSRAGPMSLIMTFASGAANALAWARQTPTPTPLSATATTGDASLAGTTRAAPIPTDTNRPAQAEAACRPEHSSDQLPGPVAGASDGSCRFEKVAPFRTRVRQPAWTQFPFSQPMLPARLPGQSRRDRGRAIRPATVRLSTSGGLPRHLRRQSVPEV